MLSLRVVLVLCVLAAFLGYLEGQSAFSWMKFDEFDEIDHHLRTVNKDNCHAKSREELVLRPDTVAQLPVYNQLRNRIWYPNRTSLIHIHNMALNRAFFYSYILQKMNDTSMKEYRTQPNWLYMYISAAADVNANPNTLNGSALYFDTNCHYPNWYETIPFNNTVPLFGPKAWRHDDWQDQDNFLREPTRRVVMVEDLGAGRGMNYTHPFFKMNPWYTNWLPDLSAQFDSLAKFTYHVGLKYSNRTGRFMDDEFRAFAFFGPASPSAEETDERLLPVMFTQPYFDCGRSNKWIVSAVSPVVDFMPRYSPWIHLRRARFVAVTVMDTYFVELDFNACGVSSGNPGPSYLSGIHRCQKTTGCKHKIGYGFHRGGYICHCKPGYAYPWSLKLPYQGDVIEQSTRKEYEEGFKCTPVDHRLVLPDVDLRGGISISSGVRLNRDTNSSGSLHLHEDSNGYSIDSNFRVRNLQEVVEINNGDGSSLHFNSHSQEKDNTDKHSGGKMKGDMLRPVRPKVQVPYGMHATIDAVHDKKPVAMADVEAALNRRQEMAAAAKLKAENSPEKPNVTDKRSKRKKRRSSEFDQQAFDRMQRIMIQKENVTGENCHAMDPEYLFMSGDVAYGADKQFESEGRTALRLSHFLSNFLQNTSPTDNFGNLHGGGRLHMEHMFGEVLANVMANYRVLSSGVFWDRYMFENQDGSRRELFGPWAYQYRGSYYAVDKAGLRTRYTNEDWFQMVKGRWATNFSGLKTYKMRPLIRSDPNGTSSIHFEYFPMTYKAPDYKSGYWTNPHFRCDGQVDQWVITYVTPFFGMDSLRTKIQFKGVVTVDVPLGLLELNQCPQGFGVANAFKNTARCDFASTWCRPQMGFPFMRGAYRCDCRRGFEYYQQDGKFWIEGSLIEMEYDKMKMGLFSRYDKLKCRIAGASSASYTLPLLMLGLFLAWTTSS